MQGEYWRKAFGESTRDRPRVSVIIPVFNAEETILRSIKSACEQTCAPDEIIVVDACSTDRTVDLVRQLMVSESRLALHTMERNAGLAAARNWGISVASGSLIAFLDADGIWLPDKLKRQINALREDASAILVSCNSLLLSAQGEPMRVAHEGYAPNAGAAAWKALLKYDFLPTPTVLTYRDAVLDAGRFDESLRVDAARDLWIKLALRGAVAIVPEVLAHSFDKSCGLMRRRMSDAGQQTPEMIERHFRQNRHLLTQEEARRIRGYRAFERACEVFGSGACMSLLPAYLKAIRYGYHQGRSPLYVSRALWRATKHRMRRGALRHSHRAGLRIGFCENGAGYGGAVVSLVAFLKKLPHEYSASIYTSIGSKEYRLLEAYSRWRHVPGVVTVNLAQWCEREIPCASTLDNLVNLVPTALRFFKAFKRDRIELVYLNNDPSCNMAAALAAKLAGLPVVLHMRGFSADTKGTRWVLSNINHCFAVSGAVRDNALALGLPIHKCSVVSEGLDRRLFHPRPPAASLLEEFGFNHATPIITLVGGLIDWKGQDVLLDACPEIFRHFPDAHVLLVGSAYGKDDQFAKLITQRVAAPDWLGRVHLLGQRNDIPDILSISAVVLHTSTRPEPFGRTFLEGMAMGKPVIASNEGGPPEVIENEVDGLLITPKDPTLLAAMIVRVLGDHNFAEMLGRNAAKKAENYSIENHARAILNVLQMQLNPKTKNDQMLSAPSKE